MVIRASLTPFAFTPCSPKVAGVKAMIPKLDICSSLVPLIRGFDSLSEK
jgi:hypothetical protein